MPKKSARSGRWPKKERGKFKHQVRISSLRLEEALRIAPSRLRRSPSLLVEEGLRLWWRARQRELFDQSMRRMVRDPQAMALNRQISEEFSVCDNDGLEGPGS